MPDFSGNQALNFSVTNAAQQIVYANSGTIQRPYNVTLYNTTGADVWVGFSSDVTVSGVTEGFKLPNNSSLVFDVVTAPVWVIATAAGPTAGLYVLGTAS